MSRKYPWADIKSEYVEGIVSEDGNTHYPTLQELAGKYGCSESTIRQRSGKEDWATQRNIYRSKLEQKRQEKKFEELASKSAEFDSEVLRVVDVAMKHIQGHFLKMQDRLRESRGRDPMPINMLKDLGFTLERYQRIGKLALGEMTDTLEHRLKHSGQVGVNVTNEQRYYIIEQVIGNPELANRIRENWRQRIRGSSGER